MKILVTGATGFVGQHLVKRLSDLGHSIVSIERDTNFYSTYYDEAVCYGDIADPLFVERVVTDYAPDVIFHLAAQSIVRVARKSPYNTFETNVIGSLNILDAARNAEVPRVMVMTSDKVYGNAVHANENHKLVSSGFYETSKVCVDHVAQMYQNSTDMIIAIFRCCNIYGPGDRNKRIIPNMIQDALNKKNIMLFKGNDDKREYIYVDDLVDAFVAWLKGNSDVKAWNVGSQESFNQEEIANAIASNIEGTNLNWITPPDFKASELKEQSLNSGYFRGMTGWRPKTDFNEGIKQTVEWWKEELGCKKASEMTYGNYTPEDDENE
tara:strand:- start:526 stop:1497 length:972 start_codon:yes stop_codon:yes gene_type:complete